MNKRACYIGFLFALVVIASALVPLTAVADFSTGEKLSHNLSVCMNKQDAIDIVNAHKEGGREAASKLWVEAAGCDNADIVGYSVGKVAYAVKVDEGQLSVELTRKIFKRA